MNYLLSTLYGVEDCTRVACFRKKVLYLFLSIGAESRHHSDECLKTTDPVPGKIRGNPLQAMQGMRT